MCASEAALRCIYRTRSAAVLRARVEWTPAVWRRIEVVKATINGKPVGWMHVLHLKPIKGVTIPTRKGEERC